MRRLLVLATLAALAALAATAPAFGKGPSGASLSGPGLGHSVPLQGDGEGGTETTLGAVTQLGGFFPQVFQQIPDPTARTRPTGNLGPRYQIVYRVPGPNNGASMLVQDVYPYAKPSPVTYMRAGQRFWGFNHTHGGWFVSEPGLETALVKAGLPASPPTADTPFPWRWTGLGAAALAVALLVLARRRRGAVRLRALRTTS